MAHKGLTTIAEIYQAPPIEQEITIYGWVRTRRTTRSLSFLEVQDGSTLRALQAVLLHDRLSRERIEAELHTGAGVRVTGILKATPNRPQPFELEVVEYTLLGAADPEAYPLQKKSHSLEFLREIAHLRPRTRTFQAIFRLRSGISFAIHQYFQSQGFVYVHTPILTPSDCEGGGQLFQVTTLPLSEVPKLPDGSVAYSKDFFGRPAYLTVSGQLEGELLAMGLGKIYTFGPTFRAEPSHTPRHLAEFWMIEPEMAFYDLPMTMDLAEDFLKYLIRHALEHYEAELAFLAEHYENHLFNELRMAVENDFVKLSYTEAVEILQKSGRAFQYPTQWGSDLQAEHERYLVEEYAQRPVIVYNYPRDIKAFYMRQNDDGRTVAAFDVLFPRIGEVIGGSQREERYDYLLQRMQELRMDLFSYQAYLDTRRYGTVPHSGFGLGLERILLFITGMANVRDVIPFFRAAGQMG
ncbi:MAG: asparagine--tRNA ligase [Bacteroidia bacterium]|nr:asparagine--tRNA ligase [Bacteroidia bacterium]MCX7651705.1 asparagine--tRNA ligase [Bacteroidia bacterium]MDW8417437.1 asparagine--tRNA ligase [Bacteroidia bacterium]